MKNKVYSGIDKILCGTASDKLTDGCMVLEGGAFRGVYTEGVLDYLMKQDINMQCTIGVSAGALNAANYVAGQIGRSARTNLTYRHNNDYVGLGAIKKNDGIIGFDFLYGDLDKIDPLDKTRLFDPSRKLVAVVTNLQNGKTEYMDRDNCGDFFQAIRASASMPFVSKPVYIDDIPYVDGACSCKTPYKWALENGYEKIIIIKTREDSYTKPPEKPETAKLCRAVYHNFPEFAESLSKSNTIYNDECDEIEKLKKEGRVFVISPSKPVDVGKLEPDMEKLGELYFFGVEDAKRNIEELKRYLEK